MCGLTGFYSLDSTLTKGDLEQMTEAVHRRGPDAHGIYFNDGIGLGHRRLSIIDLSAEANQPFHSTCGNYVIVFNGEVYNYQELVVKHNLTVRTSSDTEVIIELFKLKGKACVQELNGMFAFAIYDIAKRSIFICRDRLGVKPLFFYKRGATIAFASELKALTAVKKIASTLQIDKKAIGLFLNVGYIPQPRTIYEEIQKFPSGAMATLDGNGFQVEHYWIPEKQITAHKITSHGEAKEKLKTLLQSSIQYRMISDVPFGTFLSGGIDSSLVTALAQEHSNLPIQTFSIGFEETLHDESVHARKVANYLKTSHEELIVSEKIAIESIEEIMMQFDEPYSDSSALPTWLVSKMAGQKVKMVLTGDGGDELFMGYGAYNWADRLSNKMLYANRKWLAALMTATGKSRYQRIAQLIRHDEKTDIRSHIFSQEQYCFSEKELESLLVDPINYQSKDWIEDHDIQRPIDAKERQALFDLKYYLRDDLLVKVDRMSMYCSIEAREPLLDYRLAEFSLNLDPSLRDNKVLLKEILYEYVPQEYFQRPKKGFSIPLNKWLKGDLRYLITKYLSKKVIDKYHVVHDANVRYLLTAYDNGSDYLFNRIWLLILLHKWLEDKS
ncbi:MAG: asnB [Cytophagaceae bacterium]|jgi:asparagine synthase (glutamine-hydrolysing)|nr:asnB [Cytophagaceae bacterium]